MYGAHEAFSDTYPPGHEINIEFHVKAAEKPEEVKVLLETTRSLAVG
jgi:hypothetical protein